LLLFHRIKSNNLKDAIKVLKHLMLPALSFWPKVTLSTIAPCMGRISKLGMNFIGLLECERWFGLLGSRWRTSCPLKTGFLSLPKSFFL
jgi:hypothetical protein